MDNKIERKVVPIPHNFESGVQILGATYNTRNVIEAGVLASIPVIVVFVVLPLSGVEISTTAKVSLVVTFSGLFAFLGMSGINGDSFIGFFGLIIKFNKNKRTAFYNPRIKKEAVSILNTSEQQTAMLPRDKVIALYKKYMDAANEKERQVVIKQQEKIKENGQDIYFEDDIGVLDKPVEYMSKKEYKEYVKQSKEKKGVIKLKK